MKLNPTHLRYLSSDEFRVLQATEMGSRNHEIVPTSLITHIAQLPSSIHKTIATLAKQNLIAKVQNAKYDGYRLTYGGYDFLALKTLAKRDAIHSVGNQIGVGKESDIYIVADADGNQRCLKIHRLGRVSFRSIKANRDYLKNKHTSSWKYMARLAAAKEYAFLKVLYENRFPVPKPFDQNRHCLVMELMDAYPLYQIQDVPDPGLLYSKLMNLIVRLASAGLIHGDFNEFNLLVHPDSLDPVLIDFPQMVSTRHRNAEMYFNRDVQCIRDFFRKRFQYESKLYPRLSRDVGLGHEEIRLDVQVSASGFSKKDSEELQKLEDILLHPETENEPDNELPLDEEDEEKVYIDSDDQAENLSISEPLENDTSPSIDEEKVFESMKNLLVTSDSGNEEDPLEGNLNHEHRPYRDHISESKTKISLPAEPTLDMGKIKKRVQQYVGKTKNTRHSRNSTKGRDKRRNQDAMKGW